MVLATVDEPEVHRVAARPSLRLAQLVVELSDIVHDTGRPVILDPSCVHPASTVRLPGPVGAGAGADPAGLRQPDPIGKPRPDGVASEIPAGIVGPCDLELQGDLALVAGTQHLVSLPLGLAQRRQQQPGQNRDHRDDDQQLDQRERAAGRGRRNRSR